MVSTQFCCLFGKLGPFDSGGVRQSIDGCIDVRVGDWLCLDYTLYLKRATPQNIVIGGIAGASPPLLGWVAVTGSVDPNALLLVAIIFAWTPPHFWALCLAKQAEYAEAGIPMLPVTHGRQYTKLHMVLYTLLMVVVTLLPVLTGCVVGFMCCGCLY